MKKTIIALMAATAISAGAQQLTLTAPTGGTLASGSSQLNWSDAGVGNLTSWELSFTIEVLENTDGQNFAKNGTIFFTNGSGTTNSLTLDFWKGYLQLNQKNTTTIINSTPKADYSEQNACYLSQGEKANVTLSFIATLDDNQEITGGTCALTVTPLDAQGAEMTTSTFTGKSEAVNSKTLAALADIEKASNNTQLTTNEAGVKFSNITLKAIPEPTTATLSLLALAGLAARRRRR